MRYILSALVMPCTDDYFVIECQKITLDEAIAWVHKGEFISAVGHESTAQMLSKLLKADIKPNRIFVNMQKGDEALAIQFLERIQEGKVLDLVELLKLYKQGKIVFRLIMRKE